MFDTGFVAYFRGWDKLRAEDRGTLLEHLVLGELQARFLPGSIFNWRDKQKYEVDFVLKAKFAPPQPSRSRRRCWSAESPWRCGVAGSC